MPNTTYKLVELVGVSENSVQEAIRSAVDRAGQTLHGMDWFEVTEIRGLVRDGHVAQFQVKLKVGFRILSDKELLAP